MSDLKTFRCATGTGFFALLTLLGGCFPTGSTKSERAFTKTSLVLTSSRRLELEPCGCSVSPEGGIEREWVQLAAWRASSPEAQWVPLSAGTTFVRVPAPETIQHDTALFEKALLQVRAMNEMGIAAVGPSALDGAYGLQKLRRLETAAKFPFVSTNLVDKRTGTPVFKRYALIAENILVFSVTGPADAMVSPDLDVLSPEAALASALEETKTLTPTIVVLLSSLPRAQGEALAERFPRINILFTSEIDNEVSGIPAQKCGYLSVTAKDRARDLVRLDLDVHAGGTGFYGPEQAAHFQDVLPLWLEQIEKMKARLKANLPSTERNSLTAQLGEAQAFVTAAKLAQRKPEKANLYWWKAVPLNDVGSKDANPMSEILRTTRSLSPVPAP